MGTDYSKFLLEAHRVLGPGGFLWIAEVRSRFVPDNKSTENFAPFLGSLQKLGFKVLKQDAGNKMFVVWIAKKVHDDVDANLVKWPVLKPCLYKRR
jgi:ribosomal RNA-processing protein 8